MKEPQESWSQIIFNGCLLAIVVLYSFRISSLESKTCKCDPAKCVACAK